LCTVVQEAVFKVAAPKTKDERIELGAQAIALRARRMPDTQIAEQLGVHRNSVPGLIKAVVGDVSTPEFAAEALHDALATFDQVQRRAWQILDARRVVEKRDVDTGAVVRVTQRVLESQNRNIPALLAEIRETEVARIKLLGLAALETLNLNVRTPAERVKAFEEWRRKRGRPALRMIEGAFSEGRDDN
jgi:hypothetical protein